MILSNYASIEFYNSVMDGVREYHSTALSGVEIDGLKVAPPPKVKLTKDNINKAQSALLDSVKSSQLESNPFESLRRHNGKYFSIMHDGIQKFAKELNGAMIRTLNSKSDIINIINVPWSLTEIAEKLVKRSSFGLLLMLNTLPQLLKLFKPSRLISPSQSIISN